MTTEIAFVPPTAVLTKNYMGHNGPRTLVVKLYGDMSDARFKRETAAMEHRAHQLDQTPKKPRVVVLNDDNSIGF